MYAFQHLASLHKCNRPLQYHPLGPPCLSSPLTILHDARFVYSLQFNVYFWPLVSPILLIPTFMALQKQQPVASSSPRASAPLLLPRGRWTRLRPMRLAAPLPTPTMDEAGNLERFLSSTMPSVLMKYFSKVRLIRIFILPLLCNSCVPAFCSCWLECVMLLMCGFGWDGLSSLRR